MIIYDITDWFFGQDQIGRLKSLIFPGIIGMLIGLIIFGEGFIEDNQGNSKYVLIVLGFPVWMYIKKLYWNFRFNYIIKIKDTTNKESLQKQIFNITYWNPPVGESLEYICKK